MDYHPIALDALFILIESVANGEFRPTHPTHLAHQIFTHIYNDIICNDSIKLWKAMVLRCLDIYASKSVSQRAKTFLLHNIVNPIVATDAIRISKHGNSEIPRLMDKAVIESIHKNIWKASLGDPNDDLTQRGIDHTRMEALQLTAMLVKYHHSVLHDMRQDIIEFGWVCTCFEDSIIRHSANVVIGYCITYFETTAGMVQHVYISLLESRHDECSALLMQALQLIAPVLPKLCNTIPDDRNPIWVVATRRILTEQRQNVLQTATVFYFLTSHAELFYEYRDKFIIHIVKSLRTIAPLPKCSTQSKKLVLRVMTLVWQWEQQRVEGKKLLTTEKRKLGKLGGQPITSSTISVINLT
jgi:transformation/transcription domain-associated protein